MKVVLLQDVRKVGKKYDVIDVADGYARNQLIPLKLAVSASPEMLAKIKNEKNLISAEDEKRMSLLTDLFAKLDGTVITVKTKWSEQGSLYEKLNEIKVAEIISKNTGMDIDPQYIQMSGAIKTAEDTVVDLVHGTQKVHVTLHFEK